MNCPTDLTTHWATVIDVAMHFNQMLVSTRSLVASVMTGVLGAAALSAIQLKDEKARIGKIPVGILILAGELVFLMCMFVLDHFYYYRLLLGSVDVAETLEAKCSTLPNLTITLSQRVSRDSAFWVSITFYGAILIAIIALGVVILVWDRKRSPRHGRQSHTAP